MALRRFPLLGVLLLGVVASICGVALAAKNYPDRVGDVKGGGGPDIASVTLSNTASTLTFRIRFVSAPPLRVNTREKWVDMLLIEVDVPPLGSRPSSPGGEWLGADFALGTHGQSGIGQLVRLGKKQSAAIRVKTVTSGRTVSLTVPRRALGGPRWLTFRIAAAREGESGTVGGGFDVAPQHGTFRYGLS
jgi:hypothetical protein